MLIDMKGCVGVLALLLIACFAIYAMGSVVWDWIV